MSSEIAATGLCMDRGGAASATKGAVSHASETLTADASPSTILDELLAGHQRRIFRIALRMLGDIDEASSATQDCFIRAYSALDRCPADAEGRKRWLTRLIVNRSVDHLRLRKWRWWRGRAELSGRETAVRPFQTPEREVLNTELGGRLMQALNRLSARQRAVFVLRHYEDYPLEKIAGELGVNVGTVKTHLSRAIERLRDELKEFYETRSS